MADSPLKRVVIVDDSVEFRLLLALHLDALDIRVVAEADEGRSGLAAVLEAEPDLVVTDLQMPGEDGIWLTRRLGEERPDLTVVMATSTEADSILVGQAIEAGATRIVCKLDGPASVAAVVHQTLTASQDGPEPPVA
ncbi:response regulator transcription factor [Egicoccus sp. AB-alg6-2]|uniref:response regulator n=1 Tax=Egicoccus sp. AB-alg6-2 TaxID=3242692 RepID=UPI00359E928F